MAIAEYFTGFSTNSIHLWLLVLSAIVIVLISNVVINFVRKVRQARHLSNMFPSAPGHWLKGHLDQIRRVDGKTLEFHLRCTTEYKTCYLWRVGPAMITLALVHPDTVKVIQTSHAPKTDDTYIFATPFIGDGLIMSKGNKWFRMRRLLTPAFHFEILKPYVGIFQESTQVLLDKWSSQETGQVELFHHVSLMTLDSILKCAFSYKSNCQIQDAKNPYIKAVYEASKQLVSRLMNPLLYSDFIYKMTPEGWRFSENCTLSQVKAKEVIKERRAALQNSVEQDKLRKKKHLDFLDILLEARDESGNGLSDEEIMGEVMTFMFAGHDTTASALVSDHSKILIGISQHLNKITISWTLYNLARFPEHQEKCRQEIDEVLGDKDELEWNDLSKLQYTLMCIKETTRMYPPVPSVSRLLDKPYEIDGRLVPEGTRIMIGIFGLHRNPHVWKDPETFDPLRFTTENKKGMSPYAYIPFSAGPRNCIGQSFALAEVKTAVAMIIRKFELSVEPKNIVPDEDLKPEIILRAKNGIVVNISPRSNQA